MITTSEILALKNLGEGISKDIIEWRRALHKTPELKMDVPQTEALIVKILTQIGVDSIQSGVGGHGVCALIKGDLPGKCLAIRADCDGLPIKEETGLEFASTNGNMHACGHDSHTAMALGAAKLLVQNRHLLKGSVKLIFQPYEEGDGGAKLMLADNVLDGVDAIIGLHNNCACDDDYIAGDVLATPNPISANIYAYDATFSGTTSHVCYANTAINAVHAACNAVTQISDMDVPPHTINAITVVSGGVRNNVIPQECTISGSIRSFDGEVFKSVRQRVADVLQSVAAKTGTTLEVSTSIDLMATENDKDMYDNFYSVVGKLYPERGCVALKNLDLIGEDFARFSSVVPGLYFMLHTRPEGQCYPLHHPKFDVNESVLHKGSTVFAGFALMWQN